MKRFMMIASALMIMVAAGSCERYEDGRPSRDVRSEFARMYPDAWDVEWEYQGNMWEVSFETGSRPDGTEREAWYDMDGNWVLTVTDVFLMTVPQDIRDYLLSSEFGTGQFRDSDADYVQTPEGNYYRFDIRFEGREIEVDVTEDGKVSESKYGFWLNI